MADAKKKKPGTTAKRSTQAKKTATPKKKAPVATAEPSVTKPAAKSHPVKKMEKMTEKEAAPIFGKGKSIRCVGKRKNAIVRIRLFVEGEGKIQINRRPLQEYFKSQTLQEMAVMALSLTNNMHSFDVDVVAHGGGASAQAQGMRHAIARALVILDKELKKPLKKAQLLTRDARIKERKKYGLHRARRGPQFSKR